MPALRSIVVVTTVMIVGCLPGRSGSGPMERHSFAEAYADVSASVWAAKRTSSDTVALARVADSVLASRGITTDQYRKTFEWYNADVERWRSFYDEVTKILEDRSRREAEKAAESRAPANPSPR